MTAAMSTRQGRHLGIAGGGEFGIRVLGPDGPPSLALRLPGEPDEPSELGDPNDPSGPGDPSDPSDPSEPSEPGAGNTAPSASRATAGFGPNGGISEAWPEGAELLRQHPITWNGSPDPLRGSEIWRAISPTTVLAGLRDTTSATYLLQALDFGRLNGLRFRMSTARPATSRRDRRTRQGRTFGTVCALSTLLCWPGHAREDLTVGAARAAKSAMQRQRIGVHPEPALVMRWVIALAERFPGDPMALAPLLLKLRWFDGGQEFLLPARWPSALLSGDAVAVSGAGSVEIGAGLGAADPDPIGFAAGLESRAGQSGADPVDDALRRALQLARRSISRPSDQPA
jgi:hypothetical protein